MVWLELLIITGTLPSSLGMHTFKLIFLLLVSLLNEMNINY